MKTHFPFSKLIGLSALCSFFLSACSVFGIRSEETPVYEIQAKDGDFEIRKYQSYIVAKTRVEGEYSEAQSKAFRILAGYIFGGNTKKESIEMTAPVDQKAGDRAESQSIAMTAPVEQREIKESQSIAMTAPVEQKESEEKGNEASKSWEMTFMMPSKYSMAGLPKPDDNRVRFEEVKERLVAAYVFSNGRSLKRNQRKEKVLRDWLSEQKDYEAVGQASYAGYDPPWTLPFFRRNEVLIEVKKRQ